jgi:hypothetical protein
MYGLCMYSLSLLETVCMLRVCVCLAFGPFLCRLPVGMCVSMYVYVSRIYVSLEMSIPTASKNFFLSDEFIVLIVCHK